MHPNTVTIAAWFVGFGSAIAAARGAFSWALGLWIGNRLLDGLDGTLARLTGRASDGGGYLDILLDFSIYAMLPICLVWYEHSWSVAFAGITLLGTFFVNAASWMYLSAIFERHDLGSSAGGELTTVTMPAGLIEGTETFIFYTLFLLLPRYLGLLFALMSAGVVVTIVQRFVRAWPRLTH